MPPRKKLTPRKKPRQERAVATVEAILQAATYILVKDGWAGLTTNRVAERAGVNIASLYQYFPNKEAIVAELQRRHVAKARAGFAELKPAMLSRTGFRDLLRQMVEAGVQEHREQPALHRVFSDELPRFARRVGRDEHDRINPWTTLMGPHFKNVPDIEMASFISRVAVHAIIHETVQERPEFLERPEFVEEIVTLVDRYLRRPGT